MTDMAKKKAKKKAVKAKKKVVKKTKKKVVKKKKTVKKKQTKRKVTKKKSPTKSPKKKAVLRKKKNVKAKKRKRKKKLSMEDIYPILNRVQTKKKKVEFAVEINEAAIVANTVEDIGLAFNVREMKTQAVFTVYPNLNEEPPEDILDKLDTLDDEIPPIGHIFS